MNLLNLTLEDGQFMLRNEHGDPIPGVRHLEIIQDKDEAKANIAVMTLELLVTTEIKIPK